MQEARSSLGERSDLQDLTGKERHRIIPPAYRIACSLSQDTGTAAAGDDAEIFPSGTGNDAGKHRISQKHRETRLRRGTLVGRDPPRTWLGRRSLQAVQVLAGLHQQQLSIGAPADTLEEPGIFG